MNTTYESDVRIIHGLTLLISMKCPFPSAASLGDVRVQRKSPSATLAMASGGCCGGKKQKLNHNSAAGSGVHQQNQNQSNHQPHHHHPRDPDAGCHDGLANGGPGHLSSSKPGPTVADAVRRVISDVRRKNDAQHFIRRPSILPPHPPFTFALQEMCLFCFDVLYAQLYNCDSPPDPHPCHPAINGISNGPPHLHRPHHQHSHRHGHHSNGVMVSNNERRKM